ncbi:hypothetical protein [Kordia sp.]|uniref:hypothetical protein n=1 Tax=Kordia sp. TaxID=1965332 RepID=UPI003D6B51B5
MQKKTLTEIFEEEPDSYPESILFQDGLIDYIEDTVWNEEPHKCSEQNKRNIEEILDSHSSQAKILDPLIELEVKNGMGSLRMQRNDAIANSRKIYNNFIKKEI